MAKVLGSASGTRYAKSHSYEDYLSYVSDRDVNKSWSLPDFRIGERTLKHGNADDYRNAFVKSAEKVYSKDGRSQKYKAEKPFKEEAARLNAEARKQEAERQQAYEGSSLGSNTLSRGETMLTGGEGVTLAENSRKRRSLLGG